MSELILGLDIGVSSLGFALIKKSKEGNADIEKLGVRIIPEDPDFHGKFYSGNNASKNAGRRIARSARRNLDRYQQRRDKLVRILNQHGMMPDEDLLLRISSLELFELRDKAVKQKIELQEIGRIFYHLNQKRGFKSSRKSSSENENLSAYKQELLDNHNALESKTVGQYFYEKLLEDPFFRIKENNFYRSDYQAEFDAIWLMQSKYYPDILTGGPEEIDNRGSLYRLIKNETIYFQRPLKSSKHLIGKCTFETKYGDDGKLLYYKRVMPKSHPLYQEFRIWQQLNNLRATDRENFVITPNKDEKIALWKAAHDLVLLDSRGNLTASRIKNVLKWPKDFALNYEKIEGNKTWRSLQLAIQKAESNIPFSPIGEEDLNDIEQTNFTKLWHCTFAFDSERNTINALMKNFQIPVEQAKMIAQSTGYNSDHGSISARAAKRILPHLWQGMTYDKAVVAAGYEHHSHFTTNVLKDTLEPVSPNSLRNPVVEQILNQVVNVVNALSDEYGKPTEVRVELARELKANAKNRKKISTQQRQTEAENKKIAECLITEHGFKRVNGRDLLRYRLWNETDKKCLYCGQPISFSEVYNGQAEIEHIVPRSRLFSNAMSNLILAHARENRDKGQMTALDYLSSKSDAEKGRYIEVVNGLYNDKKISRSKFQRLLTEGENIPNDFLDRQLNDSQYIAREAISILKTTFPKVYSTTGSVTDLLKDKWQLKHLLEEINLPIYRESGLTEMVEIKDSQGNPKKIEKIKDFNKRSDHRHHALDALVIALTKQSYIQKLNTLNQNHQQYNSLKQSPYDIPPPIKNLRTEAKKHLEGLLISFKKPNSKVLTKKINRIKTSNGMREQTTWSPRGALHEETVLGRIKRYAKSDWKKAIQNPKNIIDVQVQTAVLNLLEREGNPKKALQYLKKNNLEVNGLEITQPLLWEYRYTKRVPLNDQLTKAKISKIIDPRIKELVDERVAEAGNIKAAFKDYNNNPIWFNTSKKIPIRTVTVFDDGNLEAVRNGFVYLKGNHHSLIYQNEDGAFKEKVVSFWEAVARCLENLRETGSIYPIIDRSPLSDGFKLLYSLQINDLFLFDVEPDVNTNLAPHLFRLQKLSESYYVFRHQYQTTLELETDFAFKRIQSLPHFRRIQKVRLSNTGRIIKFGE